MDLPERKRQWINGKRKDPDFLRRERIYQKRYTAKNRKALNYVIKCHKAGLKMSLIQARRLLGLE